MFFVLILFQNYCTLCIVYYMSKHRSEPDKSSYLQATLSADQLGFDSFSRRANFTHLPCTLCTKQAVRVVQFLAVRRSKLKRRTLASALPNRDGEPKASFWHSSADGQPLLALGNNKSCKDADAEEDPSARYSRSDFSVKANHMVNRGELLDKLKAVHLHLLASEQWNASQIKLCHRYTRPILWR